MKRFFLSILFIVSFLRAPIFADVLPIKPFSTPSGIEVWLVEDHSSPVISLILSFQKERISSPLSPSTLLLQKVLLTGAGLKTPLEMNRFMKETPANFILSGGFSNMQLKIKTTQKGLGETLNLWTQLIKTPHFEKMNLSYAKAQTQDLISDYREDDQIEAYLKLLQGIFSQTDFMTDYMNAEAKLKSLKAKDLEDEVKSCFLSAKAKIVVVGDINQQSLLKILEETIGTLPTPPTPPPSTTFKPIWGAKEETIKKAVPQSTVTFGQPGMSPQSKEYPKYLLLEYVIQGRLFDELRQKRGLIYDIKEFSMHIPETNVLLGFFSCDCVNAAKIVKFIRSEWERLKDFGITEQELTSAKLSFKRAQIFTLTSTEAVAEEYSNAFIFNLGPKAAKTHLDQTKKVNLKEMNTFVQDFLEPELLSFVLIGPVAKETKKKDPKNVQPKS